MFPHMHDRWQPLAGTHRGSLFLAPTVALYFLRSPSAALACRLSTGGPVELLSSHASTVGSEGVEGSAFTVGSEGDEVANAGGGSAATTPVTTTASLEGLPSYRGMSFPTCDTSRLLLRSTRSLKLLRKSAPRMRKATGANRKVHVNSLLWVRTVHVRRPKHVRSLLDRMYYSLPVGLLHHRYITWLHVLCVVTSVKGLQ